MRRVAAPLSLAPRGRSALRRLRVLSLLGALSACAASHRGTAAAPVAGPFIEHPTVALATRTLIPTRTLDLDPSISLYDVVSRYWPQVLRTPVTLASSSLAGSSLAGRRPLDTRGDVVGVYVDDLFTGGQDALRGFRSGTVASLRRYTPAEEHARWGRSHPGGALQIRLR